MERLNFSKLKELLPETKRNVLLKDYTTFKVGGRAKYFFTARTKEDLIKAIFAAKKTKVPFFVLGGGSNLLVSDRGFNGLVIKMQNEKIKMENYNAKCKIIASAGLSLNELMKNSVAKNLTGLEWAVGIPGTVGGAIYGNAGSFGGLMADVTKTVTVLEFPITNFQFSNTNYKDQIKILKNKNCKFGYRDSVFKQKKNLIILSAELELKKGSKKEIEKKIKEYLACKRETQPLNYFSAGSVFVNCAGQIKDPKLMKIFPELKKFNREKKIPSAWLIEKCGLKGKKISQAQISQKHANFIVNLGEAKAEDIRRLINLAKKEVKKKFGTELEEEVQYLGF